MIQHQPAPAGTDVEAEDRASRPISGGVVVWAIVVLVLYAGVVAGDLGSADEEDKDYETKITDAKEESARLAPQLAKIRKLTKEREEVNRVSASSPRSTGPLPARSDDERTEREHTGELLVDCPSPSRAGRASRSRA